MHNWFYILDTAQYLTVIRFNVFFFEPQAGILVQHTSCQQQAYLLKGALESNEDNPYCTAGNMDMSV